MSLIIDDDPYDEVVINYKGKEIKVKYKMMTPDIMAKLSAIATSQGNAAHKSKGIMQLFLSSIIVEPKVEPDDYDKVNAGLLQMIIQAITDREGITTRIKQVEEDIGNL